MLCNQVSKADYFRGELKNDLFLYRALHYILRYNFLG